jgi:hypothetical protein
MPLPAALRPSPSPKVSAGANYRTPQEVCHDRARSRRRRGTGGHLFPGIAVVEELRRRKPKVKVRFVGTQRGIEGRVLSKLGEELSVIQVRPLLGRSPSVDSKVRGERATTARAAGARSVLVNVSEVSGHASGPWREERQLPTPFTRLAARCVRGGLSRERVERQTLASGRRALRRARGTRHRRP